MGLQSHTEETFAQPLHQGMNITWCNVLNNHKGQCVPCCKSRVRKTFIKAFGVWLPREFQGGACWSPKGDVRLEYKLCSMRTVFEQGEPIHVPLKHSRSNMVEIRANFAFTQRIMSVPRTVVDEYLLLQKKKKNWLRSIAGSINISLTSSHLNWGISWFVVRCGGDTMFSTLKISNMVPHKWLKVMFTSS